MFMPLMGLITHIVVFSIIGVVILSFSKQVHLSIKSLVFFVVFSWAGLILYSILYSQIFANDQNELTSAIAVIGLLLGLVVAGSISGYLGTVALDKLLTARKKQE